MVPDARRDEQFIALRGTAYLDGRAGLHYSSIGVCAPDAQFSEGRFSRLEDNLRSTLPCSSSEAGLLTNGTLKLDAGARRRGLSRQPPRGLGVVSMQPTAPGSR